MKASNWTVGVTSGNLSTGADDIKYFLLDLYLNGIIIKMGGSEAKLVSSKEHQLVIQYSH